MEIAKCELLDSVRTPLVRRSTATSPEKSLDDGIPDHLVALYNKSTQDLDVNAKEQVRKLLCEYADIFSRDQSDLGRTDLVKHTIETGDAHPIQQPPRRLPLALRKEADKAITEMLQQDVIEPSSSPWSAPIVLVRKKDGSVRFCIDYRKLNSVTHKDSYPLPRIDETLETLAGAEWFSSLDLKSGYWQVELAEEDREKSAFSAGAGLWQFKVMPFGLCNAPATFERLMECLLSSLPSNIALIYLDDVLVYGKSFAEQLINLRLVFDKFRVSKLKLSPKKCLLFQRQIKYLGHIVSKDGVRVDDEKIQAIRSWPKPSTVKEVRSFLGLCSYYRRFIAGFADIARPLHRLSEKPQVFEWSPEVEHSFESLKQELTHTPILGYPMPGEPFTVDTDASAEGIGAVLSQLQDGQEQVIAYFSRALSRAERNYCTTRKELLAVVRAIQHFRPYLYGIHFLIRTDHAALTWLLNFRSPEGQVARWIEQMQEYDFTIEHRAGLKHQNADALSRRPCLPDGCRHCERLEAKEVEEPSVFRTELTVSLSSSGMPWGVVALRQAQMEDREIKPILSLMAPK